MLGVYSDKTLGWGLQFWCITSEIHISVQKWNYEINEVLCKIKHYLIMYHTLIIQCITFLLKYIK